MMTFTEFSGLLMERIQIFAEGRFEVRKEETIKNNGLRLTGIITYNGKNKISPVCYLENLYEDYKFRNCSVDCIAEKVYELFKSQIREIPEEVNVRDLFDWDKIKKHIHIKLVNVMMNTELLEKVPYNTIMDLAEIYYVRVGGFDGGIGTILVHNDYCRLWNVDENILHETALNNMTMDKAVVSDVRDELGIFIGDVPDGCRMYILTNKDKLYGASEILNMETLSNIADRINSDLIIIPSSIHEVLIISSADGEVREILEMVKIVNRTQLSPEEILSYHVYKYDRRNKVLRIAS